LGPAVVRAAAGSGKTTTAVRLVVELIADGWRPESVLVVTFSRSAVRTFRRKLTELVGDDLARRVRVCTTHSYALSLLAKLERSSIDEDRLSAIWYKILGTTDSEIPDAIRRAAASSGVLLSDSEQQIADRFRELKIENNLIDFEDVIDLGIAMLLADDKLRSSFSAVIVDEAQDLNVCQHRLLSLLKPDLIAYIGDSRQAVYSFQGADPSHLDEIAMQEHCSVYDLLISYRCPRLPTAVANALMARSPTYGRLAAMEPNRADAGEVVEVVAPSTTSAAKWVAAEINQLIGAGIPAEKIAVLARVNSDLSPVARALKKEKIRYTLNGEGLWGSSEIDGLLDMARLARDPSNVTAAARLCYWPWGALARKRLIAALDSIESSGGPTVGYKSLADLPGVRRRYDELIAPAIEAGPDVSPSALYDRFTDLELSAFVIEKNEQRVRTAIDEFLDRIKDCGTLEALLERARYGKEEAREHSDDLPGVRLKTTHAAKGEEYQAVFGLYAEEGTFPYVRSVSPEELEEERRLFYVLITRTSDALYFLRRQAKEDEELARTRFLNDIESGGICLPKIWIPAS